MEVVDEKRIVHRRLEAKHRCSPSARGMEGRPAGARIPLRREAAGIEYRITLRRGGRQERGEIGGKKGQRFAGSRAAARLTHVPMVASDAPSTVSIANEAMTDQTSPKSLEEQIAQWRSTVRRRSALQAGKVATLEGQFREQIADLSRAGLSTEEAFLVAVMRMSSVDTGSREFARERSDHLWKQLVVAPADSVERSVAARKDAIVAFGFAVLAGVEIKLLELFGISITDDFSESFYLRNASLLVLPCLLGYFVCKRRLAMRTVGWLAGAFVGAVVFANLPAFGSARGFEPLTALHLPIALWLGVGIA